MQQDQLPCCDQETFERVWRRVMPADRADCPFVLNASVVSDPSAVPSLPAVPVSSSSAPPIVGPDHDVVCLGRASAVYGAQLQQYIDRELADWRAYQALARRAHGNGGKILSTLAADERRHAKRLSTAYFLISGIRYWPVDRLPNPSPAPFAASLREHFMEEQRGAAAYQASAADTTDPCLRELYQELAEEEQSHAWVLRGLLEQM